MNAPVHLSQPTTPTLPDAAASCPAALGWMQGSPPPANKLIRFADGSAYQWPQMRWSFSNFRQLVPTRAVGRGFGAVCALPRAERDDIDALRFTPLGGGPPITWAQSLAANYTDAILVLHRGRIAYERYFGVQKPGGQHIAMSLTKSVIGTLGALLVTEDVLNAETNVAHYLPELRDTGLADATVRQLLDMSTGLQYSEDYDDPHAEVWVHMCAGNVLPRPPGYPGPDSFYAYLQSVKKQGEHGTGFAYKTINADALGWVIRRATGASVSSNLAQRIWHKLGAEQDAYFTIDNTGCEFAGGGLNTSLRDLGRFGEMMRCGGHFNGQQIVPKSVVDDIRFGGNKTHFALANGATLPGWSYRNMWWVPHNTNGAFMARGVHGQTVYVDPTAEMVMVRFASHPVANNDANDATSLPAWQALADHLR